MSRFKTMDCFKKIGPINLIYSQWLGYLKMTNEEYFGAEQMAVFQNDPLVNFTYAHTTGHATLDTLKKLVDCIQPKRLVPVHTEFPEDYAKHFKMVTTLKDGDSLNLS
jgi:ribonuclease J